MVKTKEFSVLVVDSIWSIFQDDHFMRSGGGVTRSDVKAWFVSASYFNEDNYEKFYSCVTFTDFDKAVECFLHGAEKVKNEGGLTQEQFDEIKQRVLKLNESEDRRE